MFAPSGECEDVAHAVAASCAQARESLAAQLDESEMAALLAMLPASEPHMVRWPRQPAARWPALKVPPRLLV